MANQTVICTYRVKPEAAGEFLELLGRHWPTLHDLGGVTDDPARIYRSLEPDDPRLIEIFTWVEGGMKVAEHPDVVAIWERMEQLCQSGDGQPAMSFPHFEELPIHR
jgi:hypothetical protein